MDNENITGLVKVGYYNSSTDSWLYEICTDDALVKRVNQLMKNLDVKKISITKNYGI